MAWVESGGKVLIQWATATATDWVEYTFTNVSQIRATPKKPEPGDSPVIDNQPGWIAGINIQGVVLSGDHVGFSLDGQGRLVAGVWNDDPADWPFPFGLLYTFDSLAPDPTIPGNPLNTRQTVTPYADTADLQAALTSDPVEFAWCQWWLDRVDRKPWADWPRFTPNNVIHGVWLSDPQWQATLAARSVHGWEEWANG